MESNFDHNSNLVCAEDKAEFSDVLGRAVGSFLCHSGKLNAELQTAQ
jgi:hypothetical protein